MIKIDTQAVAAFRQALKLERTRLDLAITAAFQGWTKEVFKGLVERSPQWSGNMAANWNYSLNFPSGAYAQVPNKTGDDGRIDHWRENQGVFHVGHPNAVNDSLRRMESVTKGTWRDKVFITNNTPLDTGGSLVDALESGRIKVRPINLVQGQVQLIEWTWMRESQRGLL